MAGRRQQIPHQANWKILQQNWYKVIVHDWKTNRKTNTNQYPNKPINQKKQPRPHITPKTKTPTKTKCKNVSPHFSEHPLWTTPPLLDIPCCDLRVSSRWRNCSWSRSRATWPWQSKKTAFKKPVVFEKTYDRSSLWRIWVKKICPNVSPHFPTRSWPSHNSTIVRPPLMIQKEIWQWHLPCLK